jgi:geranylgeranyl diphosphate synthase type I
LYDMLSYHLGWSDQHGQPEDNPPPAHFPSLIALVTCQALCGNFQQALPIAAAVEFVYNFTLVHGDVQTGGIESQERPSIWWVWGPAQAINAGDGLHALGRSTIMRMAEDGLEPDTVLLAVKALDQACLSLCEGQYMDLSFQDQLLVTEADYLDMVRRKAGSLPGCSAQLGALASGAEPDACAQFQELGSKLGMAWQLTRDVSSLWGPEGDGWSANNVLNKKKSLPIIYAFEHSDIPAKRELGNIYMKRVLEQDDTARIIDILETCEARQYAEGLAQRLAEEAMATVRELLPEEGLTSFETLSSWALEQPNPSDR